MTTFKGFADPAAQHSGSLHMCSKLGPTKGDPTPPRGQLGDTNQRLRNACTQGDAGAPPFKGIWADPKGRGSAR